MLSSLQKVRAAMKYHIVFFGLCSNGQTCNVPDSSVYVNLNSFKTKREARVEAQRACENANGHWPRIGEDAYILAFRIAKS